jgi:hypothetical protein
MFSYFRHIKRGGRLGQTTPARERLARFLLRRLSAEEAEVLSERLFTDEAFVEEMESVERDLLDAYAARDLSASDRREVQTQLLTSDSQREKLRFAQALAHPVAARPARVALRLAVAAVLILSLCGAWVARLSTQNQQLRSEIAELRKQAARVENGSTLAFLLSPINRGAGQETLDFPAGATLVRLNLALESSGGGSGDIRVRLMSGTLVLEQHSVAAQIIDGATYFSCWIPVASLAPGAYSASVVERDGREVNYAFRVVHTR